MSVPKCSECEDNFNFKVFLPQCKLTFKIMPKKLKTSPLWCPKRKCNKGKDVLSKSVIRRKSIQRGEDLSKVDVDNIYRQAKESDMANPKKKY